MDPGDIRGRADQTSPADHAGGHPWPAWAGAPEIHYVKTEDGYVAYQIFGEGPYDVLFIGNWASNIEVMWEHPSMARYLERLGRFARVICFDKRGAGLSDPVPLGALPTLEHWMDDARIVLDAAGSEQTALIGDAEGGLMAMMFAATYPQRTRALVLVNAFAKMLRAGDYSIGMPEEAAERFLEIWERAWVRESCWSFRPPVWRRTHRCSTGSAAICDSQRRPQPVPACTDGCFRWTYARCCRASRARR